MNNDSVKRNNGNNYKILKSKKDFEAVFNSGRVIYSSNKKLKAHYIASNNQGKTEIFFAVAVNKKFGNGVWRNRIKRLLRESISQAKIVISEIIEIENLQINIVFSPNHLNQISDKKIGLNEILPDVTEILISLRKQLF